MKKNIFSLAFCDAAVKKDYLDRVFFPFLSQYKDYIFDIYFTCLVPPFDNDAMNAKRHGDDSFRESMRVFELMMNIQKRFGIRVSATFNSIKVDPTMKNLDTLIKSLKPLYARGLRSITIPHYHWILTKKLQNEFPQMFIKNTILRKVSRPQNYVDNVEAGFNLVNIDRYNLRDRDNLKRLKKAYDKYKVPMSILVNEGCRGACPAMDEHFELNCSADSTTPYFEQDMGMITCESWKRLNPAYRLQSALMPSDREDFEEILEYVQVLKLHGRTSIYSMENSMSIIRRYADPSQKYVMPGMEKQLKMYNYDEKVYKAWKAMIKNCKFDCWDCDMCDKLQESARVEEMVF